MTDTNYLLCIVFTGAGATAVVDTWTIARRWWFGIAPPNYSLVGRWIAYLARGRFRHDSIAAAAAIRGERALGWTAHYAIGVAFAAMLPLVWGVEWFQHPTLLPALIVGIGSVIAPFFILQPGMGAGIAASRTPRPGAARAQSLIMHGVFGVGLYVAGVIEASSDVIASGSTGFVR